MCLNEKALIIVFIMLQNRFWEKKVVNNDNDDLDCQQWKYNVQEL